jgi:hypothetical protein
MTDFHLKIDLKPTRDGINGLPATVVEVVEPKLWRGAEEVARTAKGKAPKAFSHLVNSIRSERIGPLHYRVVEGMNYGRVVEEGGRPHGVSSVKLIPWVERVLGAREKEARDKAFLIARAIKRRGTRAQPYMRPAAEENVDRVIALVRKGVDEGIRKAMA